MAMQGSSFQPCPVCSKAIASALLPFHVDGCLEASLTGSKKPQGIALQQTDPEQHAKAGATAAAGAEGLPTSLAQPSAEAMERHKDISISSGQPENFQQKVQPQGKVGVQQPKEELPGCRDAPAHRQNSETQHVSRQRQAHPEADDQQAVSIWQAANVEKQPASQQGPSKPEEAPPKAAQRSAAPAGNAFSHMMQKQKERAQTWTFYLGKEENDRLFWHMWRDMKGGAPVPEIITHCSGPAFSADS